MQKAVTWFALQAQKYMSKESGGRGGVIVNIGSLAGELSTRADTSSLNLEFSDSQTVPAAH